MSLPIVSQVTMCDYTVANQRVLKCIEMTLDAGEIVSVIGANGAGKSTLIKLLSGELRPSSGAISFKDAPLVSWNLLEKASQIAVLPQKSVLEFPFLVKEVIAMGRYPQASSQMVDEQVISEVVAVLDLETLLGRSYTTLSGGERQWVQIARILVQIWDQGEGALYLFDEPTAPLDLAHQVAFFKLCRVLADKGFCILMAIHDINLAAHFSDRLILLQDGEILAAGEPSQVISEENIKKAFKVDVSVSKARAGKSIHISYL